MYILLSPAKSIDVRPIRVPVAVSVPAYLEEAEYLVRKLRKMGKRKLGEMMKVSPAIASLNVDRFANWQAPFTAENAHPAVASFQGEVYRGLAASEWSKADHAFAQKSVRILSGLYGILRPLDLMQAYRLEMGTRWPITEKTKNLYGFWGSQLSEQVEREANGVVVNLASAEYSKAVLSKDFTPRVITPVFQDFSRGEYRSLMTYAKHARGAMARFSVQKRLRKPEELKEFTDMGYAYDAQRSSHNRWVFTRDTAANI
jgi:uncharacterized protein